MQIYRELEILTARPAAADMAAAPHRLYGVLSVREACTAARWRTLAVGEVAAAIAQRKLPILAGGTGLYLKALAAGLAPVPPVPRTVREAGRRLMATEGSIALHRRLARLDAVGAARLEPSDRQRVLRAWEVVTASSVPLHEWHGRVAAAAESPELLVFAFLPPRDELYAACDLRFERMVDAGAIDEARSVLAMQLDPELPAMKAVGLREIAAYIEGKIDRERMIALGQQATRHYAKRQYTWFRRQSPDAVRINAQFSERLGREIFTKIRDFMLTRPA